MTLNIDAWFTTTYANCPPSRYFLTSSETDLNETIIQGFNFVSNQKQLVVDFPALLQNDSFQVNKNISVLLVAQGLPNKAFAVLKLDFLKKFSKVNCNDLRYYASQLPLTFEFSNTSDFIIG